MSTMRQNESVRHSRWVNDTPVLLHVLVLYEEFDAGLRAMNLVSRVVETADREIDFHCAQACLETICSPEANREQALALNQADLVLVSAASIEGIPVTVRELVLAWIVARRSKGAPGPMITLLPETQLEDARAYVITALRNLAVHHRLRLLPQPAPAPFSAPNEERKSAYTLAELETRLTGRPAHAPASPPAAHFPPPPAKFQPSRQVLA